MRRMTDTGSFTAEFAERRVRRGSWKLYPEIVDEVVSIVGDKSVVDVGAGIGHYVAALRDRGIACIGIDGIQGIEQLSGGLVLEQDVTHYPRPDLYDKVVAEFNGPPQWSMSIEVGEHIPREHESAFFDALCCFGIDGVILSWASIGQKGSGHVNCRTSEYVTQQMVRRGYSFDEEAVIDLRSRLTCRISRQLLVFRKGEL